MYPKNVPTNWLLPSRNIKGIWAEWVACLALRIKGFRILARRYRTPRGEIDIIAVRGGMLIAVEVKFRQDRQTAAFSLTFKQRQRITRSLEFFLSHYPQTWQTLRFDVMLVSSWRWPQHIQNAWLVGDKQ